MQIEDKTTRSPGNGLLKPLIDLKVVPVPLILIHEISAAVERNKKWGSKNKIGHSIFLRLPPPLPHPARSNKKRSLSFFKTPTTFWTLRICRMQSSMVPTTKLHRIAYHRRVGGGGGEGVRMKEWKVSIQSATYVVSCFKQTSRRLLELSKMVFLSPNELTVVK